MSLKVSIKIPAIPELNTDNLSKQHLEPVWRSAANGVATAVKTHFLSLGGDRFWGEASENIRPFYNAMPSLKQNIPHPTRLEAEYLLPNGVKLTAGNALKVETGRDGVSRYILHVHD